MNTSTSYVECGTIKLEELIELFEYAVDYIKRMNEAKAGGG